MKKLTFDELYALLEGVSDEDFTHMTESDAARAAWLSHHGWTLDEYETAIIEMFNFTDTE